jgi:hypothetical protein
MEEIHGLVTNQCIQEFINRSRSLEKSSETQIQGTNRIAGEKVNRPILLSLFFYNDKR